MNKQLTDDQLVAKIIEGDDDAFGQIVDRYQAPLSRYVQGIIFSSSSSADVVQETFIKTYVNLRSYRPGKKFSSWIYRIAHNEAVNYLRKHRKELTTDDETWFDRIVDDKQSLDDLVDARLDNEKLQQAVSKLKEKYRSPLVLHVFQAKSYEEVSEILRIPTNTVGTRISRAKKMLKDELTEKGEQDDKS